MCYYIILYYIVLYYIILYYSILYYIYVILYYIILFYIIYIYLYYIYIYISVWYVFYHRTAANFIPHRLGRAESRSCLGHGFAVESIRILATTVAPWGWDFQRSRRLNQSAIPRLGGSKFLISLWEKLWASHCSVPVGRLLQPVTFAKHVKLSQINVLCAPGWHRLQNVVGAAAAAVAHQSQQVKLKGCNLKISERDFCPSVSISGTVAVPPRRFWVASSWEAKLTISFHVLCTLLIFIVL